MPFENGHYKNLPKARTHVLLLDRKGNRVLDALVLSRIGRQGVLKLAYVDQKGKSKNRATFTTAIANDHPEAADKSVRFRWCYSRETSPRYSEGKSRSGKSVKTAPVAVRTQTGRISSRTPNLRSLPRPDADGKTIPSSLN